MSLIELFPAAGVDPKPPTPEVLNELLDRAVAEGVPESEGLDWKETLPPTKNLKEHEFVKDVAAMANRGGGVIVYGVDEDQKSATERVDAGVLTEVHERTLRNAAITAITPPVFGLGIYRVPGETSAVIVEVPASTDGPHLIFGGEYFGAPLREDADTIWMKERQIEAMYRARFEERRSAERALDVVYQQLAEGRDSERRAWFIGLARPRVPATGVSMSSHEASEAFSAATQTARHYAGNSGIHPLDAVDRNNPRPGLRRWIAVNKAMHRDAWREAWAAIHHDGTVSIAAALGGHRSGSEDYDEGGRVRSRAIETALANLAGLMRETANRVSGSSAEYDVRVGLGWNGEKPLLITTTTDWGEEYDGSSIPLHRYVPVERSVNAVAAGADFQRALRELAQDCVNQGGITFLQQIMEPQDD